MDNDGPSIRESLESAFDDTELPEVASVDTAVTSENEPVETKPDAPTLQGEMKKEVTPPRETAVKPGPKPLKTRDKAQLALEPLDAAAPKAPNSWKPTAKEKWAGLPPEVQQEAIRIDRDVKMALQDAAESKKFAQSFKETIAPYEPMIRSLGMEPLQTIGSFMQTASILRMGTQTQKAQLIANIIQNNSIDIAALDQILSGQQPQQQAQQQQGQYRDPRVDDLLSQLQQRAQQRAQQDYQAHSAKVQDFASGHEFLEELEPNEVAQPGSIRHLMSQFLEVDANTGAAAQASGRPYEYMSLEDAYDLACMKHPEISQIRKQREAAQLANDPRNPVRRAQIAASSVKSQPSMPQTQNGSLSLHDELTKNWNILNP